MTVLHTFEVSWVVMVQKSDKDFKNMGIFVNMPRRMLSTIAVSDLGRSAFLCAV